METDSEPNEPHRTSTAWPPLPGDFVLGSAESRVAVCTLASQGLLSGLRGRPEIAIAGRVYTENVGIERMVQNLLAGRTVDQLLLCGRESRHRVGQAILSLHRNGVDPTTHRIHGATGPEPVLANLSEDEILLFQRRFRVIDMIGEVDTARILERAAECRYARGADEPSKSEEAPAASLPDVIQARADSSAEWTYDPAGFFLIRVDREQSRLQVEHYAQDRRLLNRLEGDSATALSQTVVRLGLVTNLAHAAYLGRELARAEAALRFTLDYEQDRVLKPLSDGSGSSAG